MMNQWRRDLARQLVAQIQDNDLNWSVRSVRNPWGLETRRADDGQGDAYLSSFPGGEPEVSRLVSAEFTLPERMSFYLCGHRGDPRTVKQPPGDMSTDDTSEIKDDAYVQLRLVPSGTVVRRAFPPRSDTAQQVDWDLSDLQGQTGVLEVVDGLDAPAYAWLGVARFDPHVVSVPRQDLRKVANWQRLAAELLDVSTDPDSLDLLRHWVRDGIDGASCAAAAVALAGADEPVWQVLGAAWRTPNSRMRYEPR